MNRNINKMEVNRFLDVSGIPRMITRRKAKNKNICKENIFEAFMDVS